MKLQLHHEFLIIFILAALLLILMSTTTPLPFPLLIMRAVIGIAFVLLLPGYWLQTAIFPHQNAIDNVERLAMSFGLSIAIIPPLTLLLDALLNIPLTVTSVTATEGIFIIVVAAVAWWRRRTLVEEERFLIRVGIQPRRWWFSQGRTDRWLYVLLASVLFLAIVITGMILVVSATPLPLTEFYVLGSGGEARDYPIEVLLNDEVTLTLIVVNREANAIQYEITVQQDEHNIGRSTPFLVEAGQTYSQQISFTPLAIGESVEIKFFLYRSGMALPYRSLSLWMAIGA